MFQTGDKQPELFEETEIPKETKERRTSFGIDKKRKNLIHGIFHSLWPRGAVNSYSTAKKT